MDLTPVKPRKRALSPDKIPRDVDVDGINSNAFSLFPDSKRFKTAHRWVHLDEQLIERVQEASVQHLRTPSAKIVGTMGEDGLTSVAHEPKSYQFENDLMDIDSNASDSEFQHLKISTPDSVKGFLVAKDIEPERQEEDVENVIARITPAKRITEPSDFYDSLDSDLDSEPETRFESATYSHDDEPQSSPTYLSSDGTDADEELSSPGSQQSSFEHQAFYSEQAREEVDTIKWIRKRKPYGVILAPQLTSDESIYETTDDDDDDDNYIGDDEREDPPTTATFSSSRKNTHIWTPREDQVFRALVCDYGRKWTRFAPFFPDLSVKDIEAHYHDVVATSPEFRLDDVADAAENGEYWFTPPRRVGHWHVFAKGSERLVLGGEAKVSF